MISSYRDPFNANFTDEKYDRLRREMAARCGMEVPFALCETPVFFPARSSSAWPKMVRL